MAETTTIQVPQRLRKELDSFKDYNRETYAEVIGKLIEKCRQNEEEKLELTMETLEAIEEGREDARKGRVFSSKQVKKELGL